MKKIILGIAFACISFFAFASSDTKAPTPLSGEGEVCRTTKLLPNYYSVTYNCGSTTITVCCFDLYIAAYLYLQDNPASVVCAAIPEP